MPKAKEVLLTTKTKLLRLIDFFGKEHTGERSRSAWRSLNVLLNSQAVGSCILVRLWVGGVTADTFFSSVVKILLSEEKEKSYFVGHLNII